MSNDLNKTLPLFIAKESDHQKLYQICHALSSPERIKILQALQHKICSLSEISREIQLPFSSVSRHIDVLEEADLIQVRYQPSRKGHSKYCALKTLHFEVFLENIVEYENAFPEILIEMPIGMYSHSEVSAPCGILGTNGPIVDFDIPELLYLPERIGAECIWFNDGYISYNFPISPLQQIEATELSFSFELCSEAPYYNNKWPSDITISVNKTELLTYTSPGDFGGRRGKYTPNFWPITSTQFGLLKKVTINKQGVYLDDNLINKDVTFDSLHLLENNCIEFTLAIKKDAIHKGGINLFGANFGDYPQHIILSIRRV